MSPQHDLFQISFFPFFHENISLNIEIEIVKQWIKAWTSCFTVLTKLWLSCMSPHKQLILTVGFFLWLSLPGWFRYFIMMFWLFPGDGGWGHWSNWTECTKSCGGGVRTRRRECDSPRPEGEGSYCEGLGTEVIGCNTDHCPGTFVCSV